jgi:hypothetical protein
MRVRPARWRGIVVAAVTVAALLASDAVAAPPGVVGATTAGPAERVDTVPVTRGGEPRVAISLRDHRMPNLGAGDRLRGIGEVQVTNTCVEPDRRCIGRRYSFSPHVSAWLVLARSPRATGGHAAKRISGRDHLTCGQRRPNRNHHCVLVIRDGRLDVPASGRLPCRPKDCFLNLVVSSWHRNARDGNRLVIGADRPNGSVDQGKGRVSALVIRAGTSPQITGQATSHRIHRSVATSDDGGWVSIYSVKLTNLQPGDVITASARQIFDISGIHYAVFDSNNLILAQGPRKVHPGAIARRSAVRRPTLSEANGFNCTHGPSAYRTPCVSRKVGQVTIRRQPLDHQGQPVPLYVNLICRGLLKYVQPKAAPRAKIQRGGRLSVKRYRAP